MSMLAAETSGDRVRRRAGRRRRSALRSRRATSSRSSARTAPARRRCSTSSPASTCAQRGRVRLGGEDVTGLAPEQLARRGLSRTFQNLQIFFRMTALENVMVGRHRHERTRHLRRPVASAGGRPAEPRTRDAALARARTRRPCRGGAADRRAACRTARSSGSRSRARWRASRKSCCSTSRPPAAIRSRPPRSKPSSGSSRATASPSCWSSMTCSW